MAGIKDKIVAITGASSVIGEATALLQAERGSRARTSLRNRRSVAPCDACRMIRGCSWRITLSNTRALPRV
jgi:NAD(P)-dependent dehydrogenase (short-subunit alcohol dehydrogenase family)